MTTNYRLPHPSIRHQSVFAKEEMVDSNGVYAPIMEMNPTLSFWGAMTLDRILFAEGIDQSNYIDEVPMWDELTYEQLCDAYGDYIVDIDGKISRPLECDIKNLLGQHTKVYPVVGDKSWIVRRFLGVNPLIEKINL